jgi:uncharacterized HAD superfamily protein
MCYAKPGPRCPSKAVKDLNNALKTGDKTKIRTAQIAYNTTRPGIQELRDAGKNVLADKYQARRDRMIAASRQTVLRNKTPLRLGLDLDNTSGDFTGGLRAEIAAQKGLTPEQALQLMPEPTHYSFVQSGWFNNLDEFLTDFHAAEEQGVYTKMKPFPGFAETVRKLVADREVEIHVVTARHNRWENETRTWLKKHRIPFTTLTHTEDKENIKNIDVYLDDSDKQITTLQANGKKVIAFENPYNAAIPAQYRVKSWAKVPAAIKLFKQDSMKTPVRN